MKARHGVLATALFFVACKRGDASWERGNETPKAPAPIPTPSVAPSLEPPEDEAPREPKEGCRTPFASRTFFDCNPKPLQSSYPECYEYVIAATENTSCIGDRATITVSGWPSILDSVLARVSKPSTNVIELRVERIEASMLRGVFGESGRFTLPEKPGTLLGTLEWKEDGKTRLRRDPAVDHYTRKELVSDR